MLNNEMNRLFAEGGVMQEGGTVDPVSGNEVPPGAMQEEVRDDVDAKLSEGEFVIPADVVRYIGLETLMKLRDKAKEGLKRMEDIGQMGNADEVSNPEALHGSEDAGMDDASFSSEIDSIMNESPDSDKGYAKGGYIAPTSAQLSGMNQPTGAAAGDYVVSSNAQMYKDAPLKGFEMVPMTNDAGQLIYIPFINGVPQLTVPEGYKVKTTDTTTTTEQKPAETAAPVQPSSSSSSSASTQQQGNQQPSKPTTPQDISQDTYGGIQVASKSASTIGGGVGAVLSTMLGLPTALGLYGGKAAGEYLSKQNASAATEDAIAFTLGNAGYSQDVIGYAQRAAVEAASLPNATRGSVAAAVAQTISDRTDIDPMEAMMTVTNAFGTASSGSQLSESTTTSSTGPLSGNAWSNSTATESAPTTSTSSSSESTPTPSYSSSNVSNYSPSSSYSYSSSGDNSSSSESSNSSSYNTYTGGSFTGTGW